MMTLILNGTARIPIQNYSRNIYIDNGIVHSGSNFSCTGDNIVDALVRIAVSPITSIEILNDETSIYDLDDLNAKLTNITETVYDGTINVSAQITFNDISENNAANEEIQ